MSFRAVAGGHQVERFKFGEDSSEDHQPGEILIRKMKALVNVLDMDGDGILTRNDAILLAERYITIGNLEPGRAEEAMRLRKRIWGIFFGPQDLNGKLDAKTIAQQMLRLSRDKVISFVSMSFCFAFDLIDKEETGYITEEQLRQYHRIFNVPDERITEESFRVMDVDKDGKISFTEFIEAGIDFFLSSDPNSPYNHLYGPLPELSD